MYNRDSEGGQEFVINRVQNEKLSKGYRVDDRGRRTR